MKLDFGTARILCLVASALSAGYLWRAALEGDNELSQLLGNAPATSAEPATEAPPPASTGLVYGAPALDRLRAGDPEPAVRTAPRHVRHTNRDRGKPAAPGTPSSVAPRRSTAADEGASGAEAAPAPQGEPHAGPAGPKQGPAGGPPKPASPPTAAPAPVPAPSPAPSPAPKPKPKPTSPAAPVPTTPAPAPVPAPTADASAPSATAAADERPGWGTGDQNHEHTGPPGQAKK